MIRTLHEIVDRFFDQAVGAAPEQFACRPGCTGCCEVDLSVFEVEAGLLRDAFAALDRETRAAAAERAASGRHCCMIDPDTGRCIVYDARPTICRSHGLTILVDGTTDHCPLNYRTAPAGRACILDLDKLNGALVAANAASGGTGNRIRIAEIALENR